MKRSRLLLFAVCIALMPAVMWLAPWRFLPTLFTDPVLDSGAAVVSMLAERPDAIRIVAIGFEGAAHPIQDVSGKGFLVASLTRRGAMSPVMLSTQAGWQVAEIRYRIADDEDVKHFRFDVELVAQSQCDVIVRFREDGPHASACANHRPGTYGGTLRH